MRWADAISLWSLAAVPVAVFLYWLAGKKRRRAMDILGDRELLGRMSPALSASRRRWKAFLVIAALGLLSVAMARPQFGVGLKKMRVSGRDVVFVLDVSKSMLAQDVAPSRIAAAKSEIAELLQHSQGDRMGLVIFAGEAFTQCPLTVDYSAMKLFLDAVKVGSVPLPGTNIADGIDEALKAFTMADSRSKTIVLLTDGEDHSGKALEAADDAAKHDVNIFTIGLGRAGAGAPIPIQKEGGGVEYKQDQEGKTVMSALDEVTLQKIALKTGGKYYYAGNRLDLSKVYDRIAKKVSGASAQDRFYTHYEDRYQWLLIPALLLLLADISIGERKKMHARSRLSAAKIPLALLLLPFLMGFGGAVSGKVRDGNKLFEQGKYGEALARYTEAQVDAPENPRLHYNIGSALYKQEKYKEARESFEKVLTSDDNQLKERAYYNIGNCYFREGTAASDMDILSKAVDSYEKALEIDPNDKDAKYNLEVTRKLIELQKKEGKQNAQNQQQQKKDNQQQQQGQGQNQQQQPQTQEAKNSTQEQNLEPKKETTGEQQVQPQQGQKKDMGKEEAERILRALQDQERKNLEDRSQPSYGQQQVLKDW